MEKFASHFGVFKIGDTKVEVIGDLKVLINNKWDISHSLAERIKIKYKNIEIFVPPLAVQLDRYKKLNREKDEYKIKAIEKKLKEK